jgi:hypothetical protein
MANVDPYVVPIPRQITDPITGAPSDEFLAWLRYDNRWKHDIWVRTGAGDDSVDETQLGELYDPGIQTSNADELISELEVNAEMIAVNELAERVEELENDPGEGLLVKYLEPFTVGTGDTAYTTAGDQFITCLNTAAAIITLNATPDDGEECVIWRGDGAVTVSGSINGSSSIVLASQYDAPHLKYSAAAGVWCLI